MSGRGRLFRTLPAALALAPLLLYASAPAPQKPTFSTKVEAVRVDLLVTENGRPVGGLGREDFEIRDNGVPQDVALVSSEQMPLNVVLALDASDSVTGERLDHLRAASYALITGLETNDRTALVTFNHMLSLGSPLTADFDQVRQAVRGIQTSGATALFDATYTGIVLGESDVGRSLLIVFTDGADTASFLRREAVVDVAKRTDVVVYGAAVAMRGRPKFLNDIAEQTGGTLIQIESTKDLPNVFLRILEEFRQRYLLSYSPRGVAKGGWHQIEVRVKGRRVQIKARRGYLAGG
jgi:Ca-activated chloride channel family protein